MYYTCECNPKFVYVSKQTYDLHRLGDFHIEKKYIELKKRFLKLPCIHQTIPTSTDWTSFVFTPYLFTF